MKKLAKLALAFVFVLIVRIATRYNVAKIGRCEISSRRC